MPDSLPLNVLAWGRGWQWPVWIKHLDCGKDFSLYPDGSTMHGQKVLCWFIYRQRSCGRSRVQRFFTLPVASDACSGLSRLLGCLGTLLRAASLSWDLCLEPCPIKSVYLLLACRNLCASYIMGGHFMGWQVQLEEIHGRLRLAAITTTVYPSLKHHLEKPSWAHTWAGSQWVFLLFKANIFNKKGWERARVTLMSFQWSLTPPWYRCWFMSNFSSWLCSTFLQRNRLTSPSGQVQILADICWYNNTK